MKISVRATPRELESKHEKALTQLAGGKFTVHPKVADEPSPVKALRQMEEMLERGARRMVADIQSEEKRVLSASP
jgi:hypothetical protein